ANLLFAAAAFALGGGAKHPSLPIMVLAGLVLAVLLVRAARRDGRATALTVGLLIVAFIPGIAHYVRALVETGNPLYPGSLPALGLVGNTEFELMTTAKLFPRQRELSLAELVIKL